MQCFSGSVALIFYSKTSNCLMRIDSLSSKTQLWFYFWIFWPTFAFDYKTGLVSAVILICMWQQSPQIFESKYVGVIEYFRCGRGCSCNINLVISLGFNLDILAEKDNHSVVLFDLHPSLSNLQSAHLAAALLIPKQLLKSLKCLLTRAIYPAQWGILPCIFSNVHDVIVSNVPSKTMTEWSDDSITTIMIIFVMSRAIQVALATDGIHLNQDVILIVWNIFWDLQLGPV